MQKYLYHLKSIFLCFLLTLLFCSCQETTKRKQDFKAYFGGVVLHPKSNELLFYRKDSLIKKIQLDTNHAFSVSFDSLAPGMYTIKNGADSKYVFFDKNDSLFVRMNMNNFENNSSFFGRGMEKNNFFIELVSLSLRDYDLFAANYKKNIKSFIKSADSLRDVRTALYLRRKTEIKWSAKFDQLAKALIDFEHYSRLESYPFVNEQQTGISVRDSLPENYYDFRKKIDLNDSEWYDFIPFTRYLTIRIQSMAPEKAKSKPIDNYLKKLKIADSLLNAQITKDRIMSNLAFSYFLEDQNPEHNQRFLSRYLRLNKDSLQQKEIKNIAAAIAKMRPNHALPEMTFRGLNDKIFDLKDTLQNKKTILFFWTKLALNHYENSLKKVSEIARIDSNIQFISVNLDDDVTMWKRIAGNKTNISYIELQAEDFEGLKNRWALMRLSRIIILDKNGSIKDAFGSLDEINHL